MRLGFIGTGQITSSIVTGLSLSGAHSIWLSPRNSRIAHDLAQRFQGISIASSNQEVLDHADTIVIAVRPPLAREVLAQLHFRPDHHVVSVVSSLSERRLSELVAPAVRIARAVPLPSAAKQMSPTAIYPHDPVALELFAAVGTAFAVERESDFDAICAVTGTVAFYFAFNESMASWLEKQGVSSQQARDYVAKLLLGEATTAVEKPESSFQSLAASHTTPGGINEQFLKSLSEGGVLRQVSDALDAIKRRIERNSSV